MPADWQPYPALTPQRLGASRSGASDLSWLARSQERANVGTWPLPGAVARTSLGALISLGSGANRVTEFQRIPLSVDLALTAGVGSQSGRSQFAHVQLEPTVSISGEAACFARDHGLWGSLVVMKALVVRGGHRVVTVNVDLLSDPEARGRSVICFSLRSSGSILDLLNYDERLRDLVYDEVSAADRPYFAIRFEFD